MGNCELMEFIGRDLLGFTRQTNPMRLRTSLELNLKKARGALGRCVLSVWPNLEQLLVATGFIFRSIALTWSNRKKNEVGNPRFEVPQMLPESTSWGCSALSYIFFSKSLPTFICTSQSSFPSWMEPEHCGSFYSHNVSQQHWAASLAFWLRF